MWILSDSLLLDLENSLLPLLLGWAQNKGT